MRLKPMTIIAAICATPLAAQDLSVDPARIEACFAGTPPGEIDPPCIGAAADRCQALPGGATTMGITDCLMREERVWDRLLNEAYQRARDALSPELGARLQTAQRGWLMMRDADCMLEYERYEGGSMRNIASAACQMNHTARRSLALQALIRE